MDMTFFIIIVLLPAALLGIGLLIGLYSGVWALTVLTRPDVKQAFASGAVKTDVQGIVGEVKRPSRRPDSGAPATPTSDNEEANRREELASSAPAWVDSIAFATFVLGWILIGAMWNLGPIGLAIGILVLATVSYLAVRWKVKYLPKLLAELSRQSQARRGFTLIYGLAFFSLAVLAVIAAHVNFWNALDEVGRQNWIADAPMGAGGEKARAAFPLDKLEALRTAGELQVFQSAGKLSLGPPMFSPIIHAVLFFFVGFGFCTCSVAIVIDTRLLRNKRKYIWGPGFVVSISLFVALFPAHLIRA